MANGYIRIKRLFMMRADRIGMAISFPIIWKTTDILSNKWKTIDNRSLFFGHVSLLHADLVPHPHRLLQLLRHEKHRNRRGWNGAGEERGGYRPHKSPWAAWNEQGRLETFHRRRIQTLPGRGMRLQVQHDGHPGCDRHPPTGTNRTILAPAGGDMEEIQRFLCRLADHSPFGDRTRDASCVPLVYRPGR